MKDLLTILLWGFAAFLAVLIAFELAAEVVKLIIGG
jgi:hypothetical protein